MIRLVSSNNKIRREQGLTLIELMVSLAVAAILAVAILGVLTFGLGRDRASSDATALNDNARAALTLLTRDIASAGFLFGAAQGQCSITLAYDNGFPSPYLTLYPIWTQPETAGTTLPLGGGTETYGATSTTTSTGAPANVTQVLLMAAAPSATTFVQNTASSPLYIVQFGTTQSGSGSGALSSTQLPTNTLTLNNTQGISQGDTAYLEVPMMNGNTVCIRMPIVKIGPGTGGGASYIDSKPSPYMPTNGYQDFQTQIPQSYGTLNNGELLHSTILDLGSAPDTVEVIQYWIDDSQGFPVLWRGTYSALTDAMISSEAIAPGVVDIQMLFGTVPQNSPVGTAITWKTWSSVAPTDQIISADVALVARTLHPDPTYNAPTSIVIPQPGPGASSSDQFASYTPKSNEIHDHFSVYTTNLTLRNLVWK